MAPGAAFKHLKPLSDIESGVNRRSQTDSLQIYVAPSIKAHVSLVSQKGMGSKAAAQSHISK
jgi:hypothetical protein